MVQMKMELEKRVTEVSREILTLQDGLVSKQYVSFSHDFTVDT